MSATLERIYQLAGGRFNINSSSQLAEVLFERLGLPATGLKKTKSGHYSITRAVLERLRAEHEIIGLILKARRRGRLPAGGKVYYLGRLRFRPGLDPPELGELLEAITTAGPAKRAGILRAALMRGATQAQDVAAAVEDEATTALIDSMFDGF